MDSNAPVTDYDIPKIDYGWKPEFVAKPAPGAVEHDCTQATLVLDEKNSTDETFHWEVEPWETAEHIQTRASSHPGMGKDHAVFVLMLMPLFYQLDKAQGKA